MDSELPVEPGAIIEVILHEHAGVVDQEIERFDILDSSLNLRARGCASYSERRSDGMDRDCYL